ncbi:MAG: hypothetical protein AAB448_04340 [Patescibacteria group bacterium]
MTHLEGDWTDAATEKVFFDNQAARVRYGLDIAEDYGALLTIESEIPMAQGMVAFDDNFFAEVLERGHGVGTHCDIDPGITYSDTAIVEEFAARKKLIDDLVGENQNLGCSGGGGYSDWYVGATGAGFSYLNGIVGFHYLALPENERPQGWNDQAILREWYHYPAPQNETYFYPFLISKLGFVEDIHGDLLVSDGSLGNPSTLAEMGTWSLDGSADCGSAKCPLTEEDTETLELFIRDFSADFDGSRPAKITLYLPTSIFTSANENALRFLFARLEVLAREGLVTWETQRGVYDGVMEYYDTLQK